MHNCNTYIYVYTDVVSVPQVFYCHMLMFVFVILPESVNISCDNIGIFENCCYRSSWEMQTAAWDFIKRFNHHYIWACWLATAGIMVLYIQSGPKFTEHKATLN